MTSSREETWAGWVADRARHRGCPSAWTSRVRTAALAALMTMTACTGKPAPEAEPATVAQAVLDAEFVFADRPSSLGAAAYFGDSLDFDGETLVVGAPRATGTFAAEGRVFIYLARDGSFELGQELEPPEPRAFELFGASVGYSGGVLAVSMPHDPFDLPLPPSHPVYLFEREGDEFALTQTLESTQAGWGEALALRDDTLLVGRTGGVTVFRRDAGRWVESGQITTSLLLTVLEIEISGDRAAILTASVSRRDVRTHVLRREEGGWVADGNVDVSFGSGPSLEVSIALLPDRLFIGAGESLYGESELGQVAIYDRVGDSQWVAGDVIVSPSGTDDAFGSALAVNGSVLVTGAMATGSQLEGAVHVHEEGATGYEPQAVLVPSDVMPTERFGARVVAVPGLAAISAPWRGSGPGLRDPGGRVYVASIGLPAGASCIAGSDCASGHCVDDVCCDSACDGLCRACTAALKGHGVDGRCESVGAGLDPEDECEKDSLTVCGRTGSCDGRGECALASRSTQCGPRSCVDAATVAFPPECDGLGSCVPAGTERCVDGAACTRGRCLPSCTVDQQCQLGYFCSQGACEETFELGHDCGRDVQCSSGVCVAGQCCEAACQGACEACNEQGRCAPLPAGSPAACRGFVCDGVNGECPVQCDSSAQCAEGHFCTSVGLCAPQREPGERCAPEVDCIALDCAVCVTGSSCVDNRCCDPGAGECYGRAHQCEADIDCSSGFCADGVCCESACDGQCESCRVAGSKGRCVPVVGTPRGDRPACSGGSAESPCAQRRCDGVVTDRCAGYVGREVTCAERQCTDGVEQLPAGCDGSGQCQSIEARTCGPYRCDGVRCAASCEADDDCAAPSRCSEEGLCVSAAVCERGGVVAPDGSRLDCAPFACRAGVCLERCARTADCAMGLYCDPVERTCRAAPEAGDSSGCSASVSRAKHPWVLLLLGLVGCLRGRRRRR